MRNLAILTFLTLDGVMQAPSSPDEDLQAGLRMVAGRASVGMM